MLLLLQANCSSLMLKHVVLWPFAQELPPLWHVLAVQTMQHLHHNSHLHWRMFLLLRFMLVCCRTTDNLTSVCSGRACTLQQVCGS